MAVTTDPRSLTKFAGLDVDPPVAAAKQGGVYVIYGQGGVGKTTAVADLATSKFVKRGTLWLNMDAGEDSIRYLIKQGTIQNMPIETWGKLEKVTDAYANEQPWDLVCIDNLSEGQAKDLDTITNHTNMPEIQDYGKSQAHVLALTRKWVNIAEKNGILVFILMWQSEVKNERTGITKSELHLTKKLAESMGGVVGCVMHLTTENDRDVTRHISIGGSSQQTAAKFRRDKTDTNAWTIPYDIYYRRDQTPLVDMMDTLYNGVPFPAERYARKVQREP